MTSSPDGPSKRAPLVIHHDEDETAEPAAPQVFEAEASGADPADPFVENNETQTPPQGRAMAATMQLAAGRFSLFGRIVWTALFTLFMLWLTTAAWDFVGNLMTRNLWLGRLALAAGVVLGLAAIYFVLQEIAGYSRLGRIDALRDRARALRDLPDDKAADSFGGDLTALYARRDDLKWPLATIHKHKDDVMDAGARLDLLERELIAPLDARAQQEIEAAARQVAMVTAIVPLALADVIAALVANTRMVRRIALIYGGRTGTLGSWRLVRAVATHLVATGAVGVADDLIGAVAGGGAMAKLSRRFGEGIINGALTARVGLAAMDLCRPMPFEQQNRPRVTALVRRAMTGVFSKS